MTGLPDFGGAKWWTITAKDVLVEHRLDAEHFEPRYKKLKKYIERKGSAKPLGQFEPPPLIRRGRQPRYVEGGDVLVINSKNVGRQLLNIEEAERTDAKFWSENAPARAQKNDVLLNSTGVGSIGRANCVMHTEKTVVDNHVTIIRVDPDVCDPAYLAVYLNSQLGMMQTEQWLSGSSGQIELYPASIEKFVIHLPDLEIQRRIGDEVREAHAARERLMGLMEAAKSKVEAIP
jgi:hypothetical protein